MEYLIDREDFREYDPGYLNVVGTAIVGQRDLLKKSTITKMKQINSLGTIQVITYDTLIEGIERFVLE